MSMPKVIIVPSLAVSANMIKADGATQFNPTVDNAWLAFDTLLLADTFSVSDLVASDVLHHPLGPLMLDKYLLVAFVRSWNSMRNIDAASQAN
jgi:hypothetical protein